MAGGAGVCGHDYEWTGCWDEYGREAGGLGSVGQLGGEEAGGTGEECWIDRSILHCTRSDTYPGSDPWWRFSILSEKGHPDDQHYGDRYGDSPL